MSMSDVSASDIESISSADTQSDKVTDASSDIGKIPAMTESSRHPRFFFQTGFINFLVRISYMIQSDKS